jgi:PmbA protein
MLTEKEAKELCQQVLSRCGNDQAKVVLLSLDSALTRFANNYIHQNVAERNSTLSLSMYLGKRRGMASTNRTDGASLDEMVARARANAQTSPEDPGFPGLAEPTQYPQVDSFDQTTASYAPAQRAREVGAVCTLAKERGLNASGAFSTGTKSLTVANSQDIFAHHDSTEADFQVVVMGEEASGRSQCASWRVSDIPVEDLGREALQKAELGQNPRKIDPREYRVVFDPYVTQDLLSMLNLYGMSAQDVQDGRSWMNGRLGERAMSPLVNVWDDGTDLQGLPMPFDYEGVPKQRAEIVSQGVIKGPVYDRYTAHKDGVASTGHAIPAGTLSSGDRPLALNLFMSPGLTSLDEMIRTTEKGLYITRFWYTRLVHPRDCMVTGMTRDGVFMIENGEIAYAVKNLRFTQSYVQALAEVEAVGNQTRLLITMYGAMAIRVPALKIRHFNFTGTTV